MKKVIDALKKNGIDAFFVSSPYSIFYLTGFNDFSKDEREGYLLLCNNHIYLFASKLNSHAVRNFIAHKKNITLVEIAQRGTLTKQLLGSLLEKHDVKTLGVESESLTFAEYQLLQKDLSMQIIPTDHFLEEFRKIKTPDEIKKIEKACIIGDKAFKKILPKVKLNLSEKELAFILEGEIIRLSGSIAFPTIVAFGEHAAIPHHKTDTTKLIKNTPILFDFGVENEGYCSDMSRTVFFGNAPKKFITMYQTVLDAQEKAFTYIRDTYSQKITGSDIDAAARNHITSLGFPSIPHSLGHGIGIFVHEKPAISHISTDILEAGMVFSNEPGIYEEGYAGVRIEDLIVLENSGPRYLTHAPKSLIQLN